MGGGVGSGMSRVVRKASFLMFHGPLGSQSPSSNFACFLCFNVSNSIIIR